MAWDAVLGKFKGPYFTQLRWAKDDHYFARILESVKSYELVLDLLAHLTISLDFDRIFIGQEEPWPPHGSFVKRGHSQTLKQQAEISGAFLGGLIKYGYDNIYQMGNDRWRKMVADQISEETGEDVTLYHQKWKSQKLADQYNCNYKDSGKFRAKQWALDVYAPWVGQMIGVEIPDWPDIIESSKLGKIPRPEGSKARAVQPDDRYDALAIMETMRVEQGLTNN